MKKSFIYQRLLFQIVKISVLQLALVIVFANITMAIPAKGQEMLDSKVTLALTNVSLENALSELEKTAHVKFSYNSRALNLSQKINLNANNEVLSNVLNKLLKPLNIRYMQVSNRIVLHKEDEKNVGFLQETEQTTRMEILANTDITIKGTVTDGKGERLPGVSIIIKGTTRGTTTNVNGEYSLAVPDDKAILVFSFVSYVAQEIMIENKTVINITLLSDIKALDEVIVVGYGTQKKADLTGAVSTVSIEQIKNKPAVSFGEALVGQMAGVQVQQINGAPGGEGLSVRVRGTGSITAGSSPLYVIDGFPIDGNGFSFVNPSDIESIQVLKDASSTAIYGSRGANGVVIVTTKKGAVGKPTITYNTFYGIQQVGKTMPMMNSSQYLKYFIDGHNQAWLDRAPLPGDAPHTINDSNDMRSKYSNSSFYTIPQSFYDPNNFPDNNWQDLIFRTASTQKHELNIGGGTEKIRYSISGGYTQQNGIQINTDFKRFNLRTNLTAYISKKLELGVIMSAYYSDGNEVANGKDSPLSYALYLPPIYPQRNADGTYGSQVRNSEIWAGDVSNPVSQAENITNFRKKNGILSTIYAQYEILNGLKYKISINGSLDNSRFQYYQPSFVDTDGSRAPKTADARNETSLDGSWLIENTLNYNKAINQKHVINLLAGYTTQVGFGEYNRVNAQNFPNDIVRNISAGKVVAGDNSEYKNSLISYLSRFNYVYDDKYMFTTSIRSDGSSRFGAENKWGIFPSASVGWRVSAEPFMRYIKPITDLKVRASWGLVGNNRIGNYDAIARVSSSYYVLNSTLVNEVSPINYPNPALGWEKTMQSNLGLELSLLNNRIQVEMDFYDSKSVDLLLDVPVPTITGYATQLQNIGKVGNKGMEYLLKTRNMIGKFKWSTDFNISFNQNKVLALGPDSRPIYASAPSANNTFITAIGMPIATFYGYAYDGVFKNQAELNASPHLPNDRPGDPRYLDLNKDGAITADDKTYIGNNQPKFIYGFTNNFSYKNFDLSVQLTGSQGGQLFSFFNRMVGIYHGDRNGLIKMVDRWKSEGDVGTGNILRANRDPKGLQKEPSSYWVEDGSFLRIRSVTVAHTFDKKMLNRIGLKGIRVYLTGQNLFTFTKYEGFDPETSSQGNGLSSGGDYLGYPTARTIIGGLNVSF